MRVKDAVRLHHTEGMHGFIVLEFPPMCRHIYMGNRWYYLSLPFQYILLVYTRAWPAFPLFPLMMSDLRLAWRRKPLAAITDPLGSCGLPMGQHIKSFCHGNFKNIPHFTVARWMNYMVNWFWGSSFYSGSTHFGMSVEQWAKWSVEDPCFINGIGWTETTPLLQVLQEYLGFKKLTPATKLQPYRGVEHDKVRWHQPANG